VAAQTDGLTVRSIVAAQCGAELTAYEEMVPEGQSIWQSRGSKTTLDPSREAVNQVGVWLGSVYPVMDAFVMARSELRLEQRRDVAARLGRALDISDCLMPNSAQLDVYMQAGPVDAADAIKSSNCLIESAKTIHEAMLADMDMTELRALAEVQSTAIIPACEDLQ
jgi:hypothetical protein